MVGLGEGIKESGFNKNHYRTNHWSDGFICHVVFGGGVILDDFAILRVDTSSDPVDLLIDFRPMMVALLSSASNSKLDSGWMPGADTCNFPETLMRLSGQLFTVPSRGDTLESFSFSNSDSINHLVLREDGVDRNTLFEVLPGEFYFLSYSASVQLDFH